jgi:hypothetical protein
LTLGSREHHCVVGEHRYRCPLDRGGAAYESITRRIGDQIVHGSPLSLRGVGKAAVLNQGAGIDEISEVLSSGAESSAMSFGHRRGSSRILEQPGAIDEFVESIRYRCRRLHLGGHTWLRGWCAANLQEDGPLFHGLADTDRNRADRAVLAGINGMLHFH